jgi:hypothetical protein
MSVTVETSPLTCSVEEAASLLGLGRSSVYDEIRTRGCISAGPIELWPIRLGTRVVFGRAAVENFAAALHEQATALKVVAPGDPSPGSGARTAGAGGQSHPPAPAPTRGGVA